MKLEASQLQNSALRPFVVGLIGHRDLLDAEINHLQAAFDEYIEKILDTLKFTPILVLTSLAEGADRLAQRSKFRNQIKICSVLPFSLPEYSKDFLGRVKRAEFKTSIDDSDYVISFEPKSSSIQMSVSERNKAYRDCAQWICDKSNSLYAVWDGNTSRGVGGTGDTVKYRIRNITAHSQIETGLKLVHSLASNGPSKPVKDCDCGGHEDFSKANVRSLRDFDLLNSYLANSDVLVDPISLESHFELLDKEAILLQKDFIGGTKFLLTLGVLSINIASFQMELLTLASLVPASLLLLLTIFYWSRQSKSQIKVAYETFRLMAEVMRVQIWWNSCGINARVLDEIPELRETGGPARLFLSNTFLIQEISSWSSLNSELTNSEPLDWVEGQKNYLRSGKNKGAIWKNESKAKKLTRTIFSLVALGGLSIILGTSASSLFPTLNDDSVQAITSVLFTASLSIAAAMAAYSQVLSYREVIGRYRIKEFRLQNSILLMRKARTRRERLKIAKEVGRDALSEAFRWYQLKSDRQVRPFQ
jgi:hypothetical protein